MAFTFRDARNNNGGASAVVTKPTGCVDGDLLFAVVQSISSGIGAPAGWNSIRNTAIESSGYYLRTYWKIASGEGATFTFTGASVTEAVVACFTGTTAISPLTVENGQSNASSTNKTAPGVTTPTDHELLVWASGGATGGGAVTPPSGMTEPTNGEGVVARTSLAYLLDFTPAGATGNKVGTGASAAVNAAHLASFRLVNPINTISPPKGDVTGDGFVPAVQAKPSPNVGAISGAGFQPTYYAYLPLGAISGAGQTPAVQAKPSPNVGAISGSGFVPTIQSIIQGVLGAIAGAGFVPTVKGMSSPPVGAISAAGLTPGIQVTVGIPVGAISAQGFPPAYRSYPPLGAASVAGFVPTIQAIVQGIVGAISGAGFVPTVKSSIVIPLGAISAQGFAPGTIFLVAAPVGVISGQGFQPTYRSYAPLGAVSVSGLIPSVQAKPSPDVGAISGVGFAPLARFTQVPNVGAVSVAGLTPSPKVVVLSPIGAIAVAGFNPLLGFTVSAPVGIVSAVGIVPTVLAYVRALRAQVSIQGYSVDIVGVVFVSVPPTGQIAVVGLTPQVLLQTSVHPPMGDVDVAGIVPVTPGSIITTVIAGLLSPHASTILTQSDGVLVATVIESAVTIH